MSTDAFLGLKNTLTGRTVCIASGPSLTPEDCLLVEASGLKTIVANTSFRAAPWAHYLFAMDDKWWVHYGDEVKEKFRGTLLTYTTYSAGVKLGAIPTKGRLYPPGFGNSGSYAISLMMMMGAKEILLLGYDCKFSATGEKHWHADHPGKMGNASSIKRWPLQFHLISRQAALKNVKVINCSRDTALKCFPRSNLETELKLCE